MASYRGHLALSTALGSAYGSLGAWCLGLDWGPTFLGAGLTALGGLLPDLDSDTGVPVRELFGIAAATLPWLLFRRLRTLGFTFEERVVLSAGFYLIIRFGLSSLFKRCTVHRGMFHSLPALLIAGLAVFLTYHNPELKQDALRVRLFVAGGLMAGYLSHLVLDELTSVDFSGGTVRLSKYAGSALKFYSTSWPATLITYAILAGLLYLASQEFPPA
jgi:hypothetical protein